MMTSIKMSALKNGLIETCAVDASNGDGASA
jgi:hypothetical protein